MEDETYKIIGAAMEVHRQLGCGFTEKVYQDALEKEFLLRGIPYEREVHLHVTYKGEALDSDFIPDFVCYNCIIVELKAVQELDNLHRLFSPLGHPRFQVFPMIRSQSSLCSSLMPKTTLLDKDDFGET